MTITKGVFTTELTYNRANAAKFMSEANILTDVAAGEPIFKAAGGLVLEDLMENDCVRNNLLIDGSYWSGSATVAQDEVGIDGEANSAWTVTDDNGSALEDRYQFTGTVTNESRPVTFSMFIKKTTGATTAPVVRAQLTGGTTSLLSRVVVDTNNGTYTEIGGSATPDSVEIQDFGDWWRVVIVLSNNGTGNTSGYIGVWPAGSTPGAFAFVSSLTGSCIVHYPQIDDLIAGASEPILNDASGTTRSASDAYIDDISPFYNSERFTIWGEFSDLFLDDGNESHLWYINDTATNDPTSTLLMSVDEDTGIYFKHYDSSDTLTTITLPFALSGKFAITLDIDAGRFVAALNGVVYAGAAISEALNRSRVYFSQSSAPNSMQKTRHYVLNDFNVRNTAAGDLELIALTS